MKIIQGDCRTVMAKGTANSIDAICTDPPYELGFMGKKWDSSGIAFDPEVWAQAYRVLKPGGYLLAFGGTRTWHRLAVAIEDAGFELRDTLMWLYGAGFPKAHNLKTHYKGEWCSCNDSGNAVPYNHEEAEQDSQHNMRSLSSANLSQAIDASDERGEVLQPGVPKQGSSTHRQKSNKSKHDRRGQSGLEWREIHRAGEGIRSNSPAGSSTGEKERVRSRAHIGSRENDRQATRTGRRGSSQEPHSIRQRSIKPASVSDSSRTLDDRTLLDGGLCQRCGKLSPEFKGFSTALKPSWEPIIMARKPLEGTVIANVEEYGTGAINIAGCRIEGIKDIPASPRRAPQNQAYGDLSKDPGTGSGWDKNVGRWPANVVLGCCGNDPHDPDCAAAMLDAQSGVSKSGTAVGGKGNAASIYGSKQTKHSAEDQGYGDTGGASRFFYIAKVSARERREGLSTPSNHPTMKPLTLIRYLVRLVTPPGGKILDPFAGSGTTGVAAVLEGFDAVLIELEAEYIPIIKGRVAHAEKNAKKERANS